jgi:AcrR family transcriptional regulator
MLAGVNIGLMDSSGSTKRPYHHGDLRNALVSAATELAADGGPGSVSVRAAARAVGVTPTAAYLHFGGHDELLEAVKGCALDALTEAMHKELGARPQSEDPVRYAIGSLAALGRGYIAFARAEPGMFRTVFSSEGPKMKPSMDQIEPEPDHDHGPDGPFQMLVASLDELVEVGYLSAERRPMAEVAAWAMVHGLAVLLDGPLRDAPQEVVDDAIVRAMLILGHGLAGAGLTPEQETLLADEMSPLTHS